MKNKLIFGMALIGLVLVSCRKKDIQPVISLNGDYEQTVSLGQPYVESGATAMDNRDGDISGDIKINGTVNTNLVGEYHVFYDVEDSEGNKAATAERFVNVVNDADFMAGIYEATPTCSGTSTYNTSVTASTKYNNQILIRKVIFAYEDAPVVAQVDGSNISIPLQTFGENTIQGYGGIVGNTFVLNVTIDGWSSFDCTINHIKL